MCCACLEEKAQRTVPRIEYEPQYIAHQLTVLFCIAKGGTQPADGFTKGVQHISDVPARLIFMGNQRSIDNTQRVYIETASKAGALLGGARI